MSQENQKTPVVVDHHRRMPATMFALGDPDDHGGRLLTVETPGPDAWVFYLPDYICDGLQEKLNGGLTMPSPSEVSKLLQKP